MGNHFRCCFWLRCKGCFRWGILPNTSRRGCRNPISRRCNFYCNRHTRRESYISHTGCQSRYLARHVITLDSMPTAAPLRYLKQCCTILQLEVAVLQKQRKGHMKVLNVPTVVHVTEKLVYVVVTQATRANRVKHKQCWFNLPQVIN